MRKTVIAFLAAALALCAGTNVFAGQKVLLIVKDGSEAMDLMLTKEVGVMMSLLRQSGYEPVVATESGRLIKGSLTSLQPDLKLSDVAVQEYLGVIVPCMAYGIYMGIAPEGVSLVKQAFDLGMPIAAQQGGVAFLAKAGILKGKRFAISQGYESIAPEGIYQGSGVTIDGRIVTAGVCPYRETATSHGTTEELTKWFIKLLKAGEP